MHIVASVIVQGVLPPLTDAHTIMLRLATRLGARAHSFNAGARAVAVRSGVRTCGPTAAPALPPTYGALSRNAVRLFAAASGGRVDLKKVQSLASTLDSSEKAVTQYLKVYKQSATRRFGVLKVGGGVLQNEMDDLCESVAQLVQVGLIPIIVHGAGPQLNHSLKEHGIVSSYVNGLRVTTPEILSIARKVFQAENLKAVKALEAYGVRARPIQSGVYEVELFDNGSLGRVGTVTSVNMEAVNEALDAGCVPVLTCMGQTNDGQFLNVNADTAAQTLAVAAQPMKVVYISANGGILDHNREVIQSIDVNYDFEHLLQQLQHGDRRKLLEIKELMTQLPRNSTVSITSASDLARELLTHSLSGTLITNKERLLKFHSFDEVDEERLLLLLEQAFGAPLVPNYIDAIRDKVHTILVSENYLACAVITNEVGYPYLSKFAVSQSVQMEGLGARLWKEIAEDIPTMMWRSRKVNPVNRWYFQRSTGSATVGDWTVFWYGLEDYAAALEPIKKILALPKDVARPPPPPPKPEYGTRRTSKVQTAWCNVGLLGARGHTGGHLIRLIENHPDMRLAVAASRAMAGRPVSDVVEGVSTDMLFSNPSPDEVRDLDTEVDLWFLAMPDKQADIYLPSIGESTPVIDLSADHRFDNKWVYGLPEIDPGRRQEIRMSDRIANPGCYATGMMTSLRPLLAAPNKRMRSIIAGTPSAFGVSGYSGAGTTPSAKNDPERLADNLMAYSLQGHTHEREVSHQLHELCDTFNVLRFTPHVASFFQGIHLTIHAELKTAMSREDVLHRYRVFYEKEKLIEVQSDIPEVVSIVNKPNVVIGGFGIDSTGKRLVITTVIDNLMKGAAVQAMQNANLVMGLEEYQAIIKEPSNLV
eukprot:TRINITY_DN354_c0_g1_i2.p1 TRINITY_DN354_c0_g1~~TRINITY_DN354_c0_g1_i2.p1  ORF type:complete len:874 (+),score=348.15 TRINITY_DN354_c0_g1_i2:185-2806(+)